MKITDVMFKPGSVYKFINPDGSIVCNVADGVYPPYFVRYTMDSNGKNPTVQSIYKEEGDMLLVLSEVTLAPGPLFAGMKRLSEQDYFDGEKFGVPVCKLIMNPFDEYTVDGTYDWTWQDINGNKANGKFYYNVITFCPASDCLIIHEIDREEKGVVKPGDFNRIEVYGSLGYMGFRLDDVNSSVFRKE